MACLLVNKFGERAALRLRASVRESLYADQERENDSQFKGAMQFQFGTETWLRWFEKLAR
jgi:hypothetical protein